MNKYATALGLIALVCAPATVGAQGAEPNLLTSIKALTCVFPLSVSAGWQMGEPQANVKTGGVLTVKITEIDTQDGSAKFEGSTASHVVAQLAGWNLHFLDMQPAGALSLTTVFSQVSKEGKLKAVQTRTDYLPVTLPRYVSTPTVAQYYGECEAVK